MTRPDRESRFDDVDLTTLTIVELEDYLSKIVDRHVIIPDPFLARAYELRICEVQSHVQREWAIRNRRETERQDGLLLQVIARVVADSLDGRGEARDNAAFAVLIAERIAEALVQAGHVPTKETDHG